MPLKRNQSGMTMWSFMFVAGVLVFFGLLAIKLLPPYTEYGTVAKIVENVGKNADVANMDKASIIKEFDRRFTVEDVKNVDLKKDLYVEKSPGGTTIRIKYEVKVPIMYNVSALLEFDAKKTVGARPR